MNANSLETVGERVQAYLDEALSLQALSAWLLSKTAYFADASRLGADQSYDARLWARACNLISLFGDSALSEEEVRAALSDWLAEHPHVLVHTLTPR
jgi:hypothetical protein